MKSGVLTKGLRLLLAVVLAGYLVPASAFAAQPEEQNAPTAQSEEVADAPEAADVREAASVPENSDDPSETDESSTSAPELSSPSVDNEAVEDAAEQGETENTSSPVVEETASVTSSTIAARTAATAASVDDEAPSEEEGLTALADEAPTSGTLNGVSGTQTWEITGTTLTVVYSDGYAFASDIQYADGRCNGFGGNSTTNQFAQAGVACDAITSIVLKGIGKLHGDLQHNTRLLIPEAQWPALRNITIEGATTGLSIAQGAFLGYTKLTSISLTNVVSLEGSSKGPFDSCTALQTVTFGSGCTFTEIPTLCFNGCSSLVSVNGIPDTVTMFANGSFTNCASLKNITLPSHLTTLNYNVFDGCSSLTSIVIPNTVTTFGDPLYGSLNGVFQNCTSLETVTFEEGSALTALGIKAFRGCTALKSVNLPSSLTSLPNTVFYECTALESISIPAGVTTIGASVFKSTGLTSIDLSHLSISTFGSSLFSDCAALTSIKLPSSLTTIPSSMASNCPKLQSVTIPENVTSIGANAFQNCTALASIAIPDAVTSIGNYAFAGSGLTAVDLSNTGVTQLGTYLFQSCAALKTVKLPQGITKIGDYAFSECSALVEIEMPYDYATADEAEAFFGTYPFYHCIATTENSFKDLSGTVVFDKLPEQVKPSHLKPSFNSGVLEGEGHGVWEVAELNKLVTLTITYTEDGGIVPSTLGALLLEKNASWEPKEVQQVIIKGASGFASTGSSTAILPKATWSGLTSVTVDVVAGRALSIAPYTFYNCSAPSISFTGDVTYIQELGKYAFGYALVTSLDMSNWDITSIPESAFESSRLANVKLPVAVAAIDFTAFNSSAITTFTAPATLTSLGLGAFYECSSLTSVDLSASAVTTLPTYLFYNCKALTEVKLPSGLQSIEDEVFENTAIKSVSLPDTVTTIGSRVFSGVTTLEEFILPASVTSLSYGLFQNSGLKKFSVAEGSKLPDSVNLGNGNNSVFANCTTLEEVDLSNLPWENASYIIQSAPNLKRLVLPANCKSINNYITSSSSASLGSENSPFTLVLPRSLTAFSRFAFAQGNYYIGNLVVSSANIGFATGSSSFNKLPTRIDTVTVCGVVEGVEYDAALAALVNMAGNVEYTAHTVSAAGTVTHNHAETLTCSVCGAEVIVSAEPNAVDEDIWDVNVKFAYQDTNYVRSMESCLASAVAVEVPAKEGLIDGAPYNCIDPNADGEVLSTSTVAGGLVKTTVKQSVQLVPDVTQLVPVKEALTAIPETLETKYAAVDNGPEGTGRLAALQEDLSTSLETAVTKKNNTYDAAHTVYFNVTLADVFGNPVSLDDVSAEDQEDIFGDGLVVSLGAYPAGSTRSNEFVIAHMFEQRCTWTDATRTHSFLPGDIENPTPIKGADTLSCKVYGLSPFAVTFYETKQETPTTPMPAPNPDTVKPTTPSSSNGSNGGNGGASAAGASNGGTRGSFYAASPLMAGVPLAATGAMVESGDEIALALADLEAAAASGLRASGDNAASARNGKSESGDEDGIMALDDGRSIIPYVLLGICLGAALVFVIIFARKRMQSGKK